MNNFIHDANLALVLLSIAASCATVVIVYRLAQAWFGTTEARFAGLIFLFSPLGWFHGTVALTYSVEAFFSAVLGYFCWRVEIGEPGLIVPTSLILGISAGVRPSSLLFLGPLYLFSLRHAPPLKRLAGIASAGATIAVWTVPMIRQSGGFGAYLGALVSLWRVVPSQETVFNSSPATSIARAFTIAFIFLLIFGASSIALVPRLRSSVPVDPRKKLFTSIWMAPALCFFTFIFLKFVNSGYLLLLAPSVSVWLGSWTASWYAESRCRRPVKLTLIGLCGVANVAIFLASPLYCSYRSVRIFEAELDSVRAAIPQVGGSRDTLLVGFDSHFLGYRHAGYYLPDYETVQYPEIRVGDGIRVFAMHDRDTKLVTQLPRLASSRFILVPLPTGDVTYDEYLETVKKILPQGSLHTERVRGHDYVSGPISLLPLLFPVTGSSQVPGVYPPLHSALGDVNSSEH